MRQVLAGMIGRVSELRDHNIPRRLLVTAVNRGIKVDEMPTGVAGRQQGDLDIALSGDGWPKA
jgi:predicted nucleotidyltransferase